MGVIPNPKMAFIFPISCILAVIFPILIKYFPKCVGKGSFPKSQIKSLIIIVNSYNLDLIAISLRLIIMSINSIVKSSGCFRLYVTSR